MFSHVCYQAMLSPWSDPTASYSSCLSLHFLLCLHLRALSFCEQLVFVLDRLIVALSYTELTF